MIDMEKGDEVDQGCFVCKNPINFDKDLFVLLGTYEGDQTVREDCFHMNCWRSHFEEKARQKAEAVINGIGERMKPIAEQMIKKLRDTIGEGGNAPIITV